LLALVVIPSNPAKDTPSRSLLCEPQSPLGFHLALEEFEPASQGGIARLRIVVAPQAEMGEVVVSSRLRQGLSFTDGSTERTWPLSVPAGSEQAFTEEILIPTDGIHMIVLEADSVMPNGRPVHRSRGLKIFANVPPPPGPAKRGRAVEYPGQIQGEPLP
jgi:hypothetical protein